MKAHLHIRIVAVVVAILMVCMGFALYSFWQLNLKEQRGELDLYALVPQDALLVVETARMPVLLDEINTLDCSKNGQFLNFSELFNYLKIYLNSLLDEVPHGLSYDMNKMLLSFHEPNTSFDQVLYWKLGDDDSELVKKFINQYYIGTDSWKEFEYRGAEGRVYPIDKNHFLTVWMTEDFLVASLQKRLVEQVIDAWKDGTSLADSDSFKEVHREKVSMPMATAYVSVSGIEMAQDSNLISATAALGEWVEFELAFNGGSIFCSGMTQVTDSVPSLLTQSALRNFPGNRLPASTFFFDTWALSKLNFSSQKVSKMESADVKWKDYLDEYVQGEVLKALFTMQDTLQQKTCAVLSFSLLDGRHAERALQEVWNDCPVKYVLSRKVYELPSGALMTYLMGGMEKTQVVYATFYQGCLLMAPNVVSLQQYIDALTQGDVLEKLPIYEQGIGGLATDYNFLLMADMEVLLSNKERYQTLLPDYFFRKAAFFKYFTLAIQYTYSQGVAYPNLVLQYKY